MHINKKEQWLDLLSQLEKYPALLRKEKAMELKEALRDQFGISSNDMKIVEDDLISLLEKEKDKETIFEYLGCIFNILSVQEKIRQKPLGQKLTDILVENLETKHLLSPIQHITLRILFICSTNEPGCKSIYNNEGISEEIFGLVDVLLKKSPSDAQKHLFLCIQILYNFSFRCSLNEKNNEEIFNLIYFLAKNQQFDLEIYIAAYSILLNINIAAIKKLSNKRDEGKAYETRGAFSLITSQVFELTVLVFKENKRCDEKEGYEKCLNRKIDMIALCCVLERFCKESDEERKKMAEIIIPYPRDLNILPIEEDSIRGLFCQQLLSRNPELKASVGSLLFCICKNKESRLVYHFGLGNVAGFLLENNLFNIQIKGSFVSSDEEVVSTYPKQYDIVSGKIKPEEKRELSQEEEEKEKEEIAEILERFSRTKKD